MKERLPYLLRHLLPALALLSLWVPAGFAADIRVTTTADRVTPSFATFDSATNMCGDVVDPASFPAAPSLREALIYANYTTEPDTITFAPSLRGQTIRLSFDGPDVGEETDVLPLLCSGNTTLNGDINGDGRPDITLDGSNFPPDDPFGRTWGVYVLSANNTISGLTLRNFPNEGIGVLHYAGLGTASVTGTQITNNIVVGGRLGIVVQAGIERQSGTVRDTVLSSNTVSAATSHGIYVLTGPESGSAVAGTRITNNVVSHNDRFGIIIQANHTTGGSNLRITNTTLQHNEVFENGATGIVAQSHGAANSRLTTLHILDNHIHDHPAGYGIAVAGGVCGATGSTTEAEIARNTLSGNRDGIAAAGGSNSQCLSEGSLAIASHNHLTVTIADNTLEDELEGGILIAGGSIDATDNSVDATVTGNTVLRSGRSGLGVIGGWATFEDESGVAARNTVTATVAHNRVEGATQYGLGVAAGFSGAAHANTVEVEVRRNTFARNGQADIFGQGGWTGDALHPPNTGTGNRLTGSLMDNSAATVHVRDGSGGNTAALVESEPQAPFRGTLENPQPNSFQSGIGIISGWVCAAGTIAIVFNGGPPVQAAYGTSRGDTQRVCGDSDNGFGLLFNWNLLGDGTHTVQALADGVEFASVSITVTTLGAEFVQDARGEVTVPDFPDAGSAVVLRWQEAQQNFVITAGGPARRGGTSGRPPRVLESPPPGSFQSGIGIISGWVCDARRIEVTFDGGPPVEAAYGTSRGDTQGACGDTNNGFGLPFNWNLLGDGTHTVRVLADGVEFARVTVTVTTLGAEFVQGARGEATVPAFPEVGTAVVLRWQEAQQNFVIAATTSSPGDDPIEDFDISVCSSQHEVRVCVRDYACEDGDRVRVSVNAREVFSGELFNQADCFNVPVNEGPNTIELFALNNTGAKCGNSCPAACEPGNLAQFAEVNSGEITVTGGNTQSQRWQHAGGRGSRARINVTVDRSGSSRCVGDDTTDMGTGDDTPHGAEWTNSIGMEFVRIEAGTFQMGSPVTEVGRPVRGETLHRVTITQPFYLGKYEVTQGQWREIMGENPSLYDDENPFCGEMDCCHDACPVEQVSWNDIQVFIGGLNAREGVNTYRLPTEAEWEYAARAGTQTAYHFGDDPADLCLYANHGYPIIQCSDEERSSAALGGSFLPNPWGLYDMPGNLREWVWDWITPQRDLLPDPVTDPRGPETGRYRVARDCHWWSPPSICRSAFRVAGDPEIGTPRIGFRLARTIEP